MRNFHLLLMLPLLLPARFAGAAPKAAKTSGIPTVVRGDLVDMNAGDNSQEGDSVSPILAALKACPRARRIRLTWERHMRIQVEDVQFLYDRHKETLTVYSRYGGETPPGTAAVQFSPVREAVLRALVKAHLGGAHVGEDEVSGRIGETHKNNADLWGGFQFLCQRRYGCRALVPRRAGSSVVWPGTGWPNPEPATTR